MIKVEHVRLIDNLGLPNTSKLIADAELVLIPDRNGEYISCLQANLPHEKGYRGFCKPILVSRVEKIETGDVVFDTHDMMLETASMKMTTQNWHKKVLALPEHFSPEQLSQIVSGKLKDGDRVLVECGEFHYQRLIKESPIHSKYDETEGVIEYKIKLRPYITIYPFEERVYTVDQFMAYLDGRFQGNPPIEYILSEISSGDLDKWFNGSIR